MRDFPGFSAWEGDDIPEFAISMRLVRSVVSIAATGRRTCT